MIPTLMMDRAMELTIHTAPEHTRRLVHDQAFTRSRLDAASKAEEKGTAGATEERLKITAFIQRDITRAQQAIKDTRTTSARFAKAAAILRNGTAPDTDDPLHKLCADAVRMGCDVGHLADQMQRAADKGTDAADRSADRMAKADIDLRATAALAAYLARLADTKFRPNNSTKRDRQNYLALRRAAKGASA
ncbi:hypothetical protein K3740_08715 [Ruegeria conchae]|uniref:hypothetical protein n=1 Tax=Ruegeria conchae TaxID=981384 RepID=UPI0021A93E43|nr:hypothetical protein [Ruegeria conchae]UWR04742.1 hypothetical protein K3740_08715 [Ruegeria conchae]